MNQSLNFIHIDEITSEDPANKLIIQDTLQKLLCLAHRVWWYEVNSKEMARENC